MAYLIDRRLNGKKKSAVNRQRFIERHREQIRDAVQRNLRSRSITNTNGGEKITIPTRDTNEPIFRHGAGGILRHILPGNRDFVPGDTIPRPSGGRGGGGKEGSPDGEGMDDFVFEISQQEFLDFLFEDMALPNLTKRQLKGVDEFKTQRAGFSTAGSPGNIDVPRSMRSAISRRIALTAAKRRELRELETELAALIEAGVSEIADRRRVLEARMREIREAIERVSFIDDFDIRYRRYEKVPVPCAQAVMFCLMDVSGSMDQTTKDLAKRFFILLYLFLSRNYDKTEVVFIRHHTSAKEVDEEEFFYSRETGGTIVSSALELMQNVIASRYPSSQWNIYGAQASDGDNWPEDGGRCVTLMNEVLPALQYFAYIEITPGGEHPLWQTYEMVRPRFADRFAMQHISGPADIYPVFHELFRKRQP
ncbi:MAG: YeaH/YhbH family protein [Porticoccaceae bacterium]